MKEVKSYDRKQKLYNNPKRLTNSTLHFWTFSYNYIDLCGNRYKYSRVNVHDNLIQFFDDGREVATVEWDDGNKWIVKEYDEVIGTNIKGDGELNGR